MAAKPPTLVGTPDPHDGDSVERRLIQVSERLERASSDLQTLVNQLRESFQQSSDHEEQDLQLQRNQDEEDDRAANDDSHGPGGDTPKGPTSPPKS
jgi:hypothetical protein